MGFKEQVIADIEQVFINDEEFAEDCYWNGDIIKGIIDDDSLIRKYSSEFDVLPQGSHLFFVSESQFDRIPSINEVVNFNNNPYEINEIKSECGMLCIFLSYGRG